MAQLNFESRGALDEAVTSFPYMVKEIRNLDQLLLEVGIKIVLEGASINIRTSSM